MTFRKFKGQRIASFLLAIALILTFIPGSALALDSSDYDFILAYSSQLDASGEYTTDLDNTALNKLSRKNGGPVTTLESEGLYISSSDMTEDEIANKAFPYVKDAAGNTWYLRKVSLSNYAGGIFTVEQGKVSKPETVCLLDEDDIQDKNYSVHLSEIKDMEPYEMPIGDIFLVWYGWTLVPPEEWDSSAPGSDETITVDYDLNLPKNQDGEEAITALWGIRSKDEGGIYVGENAGVINAVVAEVGNFSQSATEDANFQVLSFTGILEDYESFLAFDYQNLETTEFYYFDGWTIKGQDSSEKLYHAGDIITANSSLADNKKITLTGSWKPIERLTDDQLKTLQTEIDVDDSLIRDGGREDGIIKQWTDTDENFEASNIPVPSYSPVTLDQNGTISYYVSARVNQDLLSVRDLSQKLNEGFAEFTFHVTVDSRLEFANQNNNTVTLTFSSQFVKPVSTNIVGNGATDSAQIADAGNGTYTISFDPQNVSHDEEGNMVLEIRVKSVEVTGEDLPNDPPMKLSGLDFKLKDETTEIEDFELVTTANITGSMNMQERTGNLRFNCDPAYTLLSNHPEWQAKFGGGVENPAAFVHALQFMNYVLKDIDWSRNNEGENASSVTALMVEPTPITLTPADMTIYMGGDGGYDAVVNEDGHTVTSNSLPHPIFRLENTEGDAVDFSNRIFTNAESGNSWKLVPETGAANYYHFENGAGTKVGVRVQYSNENGAVTSDKFDPAVEKDVFTEYDVSVYTGDTKGIVTAVASDGKNYLINTREGTLTVRAVENSDPTSPIVSEVPASVTSGSATAVVPAGGTTYTLNDTDVVLPKDSAPSLLFDDIIDTDANRTGALEEKVEAYLGGADADREYQIKYLDLVDANNGNAWIKSSNGTDIYWGYPTGTDRSTNFTLLHFAGLHRDGENSGFDLGDLANITPKPVKIQKTDAGIKFHAEAGDFSPYALVWTDASTPGTNPGGGSGGGSDNSDPTGNLTISLGGNGGNEDFIFTVIFTDEDGDELENNFYYNGDYTGTIGSGGEITLTGGDKIVIRNLPEGTRYEVIIETADGYTATSTGAEGVIRTSGNEAAFSVTPTVVLADPSVTGVTRWLNTTDHTAYLSGYPGGTFGPDNSMTRAEVAQMFYALLLNKDVTITKTFSDVPADAWYATAVNTLASLGMVSGDPDGAFRPNDPITRAEFCVIALAFAYEPDNAVCYFGDVSRSDWFYTYVAQAASYGWIGGYTNGNFGPNDRITRAQVTTIVNNMLGRAADRDYVIDHQADLVQFSDLTRAHWGYFQIMEATNAHNYTKSNGTESWR